MQTKVVTADFSSLRIACSVTVAVRKRSALLVIDDGACEKPAVESKLRIYGMWVEIVP